MTRASKTLLSVGLLVCLCGLLSAQIGQPPTGPSPSTSGSQGTPPTFPPGTAHDSGQEQPKHTDSKTAGKTKAFSGRIDKESAGYCLRVGDLSYKLDDQNQASGFDGQNVRVFGKLDKQTNTIQIEKIEPLSSPPS